MSITELSQEFNRQARFLLTQSLRKIEHCLGQIDHQQCWWRPTPEMSSIGNLLLHMNGNLRQWAVVGLSDQVDTRDRESEFSENRNESIAELLQLTRETIEQAGAAIENVKAARLTQPIEIQGFKTSTMQAILHTTVHFQGHTHQIIQLTRMQLGSSYQFEWSPESERGELPM